MLTDDLVAVNALIPVGDTLFFLAARQENPQSLVIGKIDLPTGEITYWNEPDNMSTRLLSVDRARQRIYAAEYDVKEEDQTMITQDFPATHTICSFDYDFGDKQEILRMDRTEVRSIYVRDNLLLYTFIDTMIAEPTETGTRILDLDTGETVFDYGECLTRVGFLSEDSKGAYVFAGMGDKDGIAYFDFETKEYTPLVKYGAGEIANFLLVEG